MTPIIARHGVVGDGDYTWETYKIHHGRGAPTITGDVVDSATVEVKAASIHLNHEPDFDDEGSITNQPSLFKVQVKNFGSKIIAYAAAEKVWTANKKLRDDYESQAEALASIPEPEYTVIPPHVDMMHVLLRSPQHTRFFEMSMHNFVFHVGKKKGDLYYATSAGGVTYTGLDTDDGRPPYRRR